MKSLESLQAKIKSTKKKQAELEESIAKIRQEQRNLLTKIREEEDKKGKSLPKSEPLLKKVGELQKKLAKLMVQVGVLSRDGLEAKKEIYKANSHQSLVGNLSGEYPILLLPVRIQTRFMKIKHIATELRGTELLDISEVNPHDKKNTLSALTAVHPHISETGKEGNGIAKNRVKTFVPPLPLASTNSGTRVASLKKLPKQKPTKGILKVEDQKELWLRIYPDDIFVHTHEDALTQDEYDSSQNFWNEVHKADSDDGIVAAERPNAKIAAWRALVNGFGLYRASYLVKASRPENVIIENGMPQLQSKPIFNELILKDSSWEKPPCTYILPDQFIVRIYTDGKHREFVGEPIPDTLILGLNPKDETGNTFELEKENRKIPDDIKWLTDFKEAEKKGMALRIPVTNKEFKNGIDKIVVLGLKLSLDEQQAKETLERLFENHQYALGGMSILKQGTPTNNTSDGGTKDLENSPDSEHTFKTALGQALYHPTEVHGEKKDGQFLAEALGVDHQSIHYIEHASSTDICEALAMNKVLYPATLGYSLDQFYGNSITDTFSSKTREFFQDFVVGRGLLPSFRIDNQPYGIIPTSSLSAWNYEASPSNTYYRALDERVLHALRKIWGKHLGNLSFLTKSDTTEANISDRFLEIMGLHASSIEFYQRMIAGPQAISNLPGQASINQLRQQNKNNFLNTFSINASWILDYGFLNEAKELHGPIVDGFKRSEFRGLSKRRGTDKNYIDFLLESGINTIKEEDFSEFSPENTKPPFSLLYLLLRHAMLREYLNVATDILENANAASLLLKYDFELDQLSTNTTMRSEHEVFLTDILLARNMINIEEKASAQFLKLNLNKDDLVERKRQADELVFNEIRNLEKEISFEITRQKAAYTIEQNKFACFQKVFPQLTGNLSLEAYMERLKSENHLKTSSLLEIDKSLEKIKDVPTARLERCFVEHLDCCNYRLDAWQLGLFSHRLLKMRKERKEGIYLGAFAIVEDLKPSGKPGVHIKKIRPELVDLDSQNKKVLNPVLDSSSFKSKVKLDSFLKQSYVYLGEDSKDPIVFNKVTGEFITPPMENKAISAGFVHAPSTNQAVAAAILKSGVDAHNSQDPIADAMAVKLNSKRVRSALYLLQGMRNGQELEALLGYQFERGLHENPANNLDRLILDIRTKYPFNAEKIKEKDEEENWKAKAFTEIEKAEGFNVVDGLKLLKAFQKEGAIPQDLNSVIPSGSKKSVTKELLKLDDALDAVNDLMIAESIFQMVVGSPDGSSAALKVLNESGEINQMPEFVNVPRKGIAITHRVGIQIPVVNKEVAWTSNKASARSKLNPSINHWLKDQLPSPEKIGVKVAINKDQKIEEVSMLDILIEPIDFVFALGSESGINPQGEIAIRIRQHLIKKNDGISHKDELTLLYGDNNFKLTSEISLFEILPLAKSLYKILTSSRHAMPEDFLEQSKAGNQDQANGFLNNQHLIKCLQDLTSTNKNDSLQQIKSELVLALSNLAPITSEKHSLTKAEYGTYVLLCSKLLDASVYDLPAAIPSLELGFTFQTRESLIQQVNAVIEQLDKKQKKCVEALGVLPETDDSGGREVFDKLRLVAEELFGKQSPLLPRFQISNHIEMAHAFTNTTLPNENSIYEIEDWLLGLSVVNPELHEYQTFVHLRELFNAKDKDLSIKPLQLPFVPGESNQWLGSQVTEKEGIPLDPLSLVFEFPTSYTASGEQMALVLSDLTETIPDETIDSGIALNYTGPYNEAPQNLLLAVPPVEKDNWKWDYLMDCINDTLEMAKMRAIEPRHLREDSLLFRILPGIIAAVNAEGNTVSLDFGRNNAKLINDFVPPILDINFNNLMKNG